MRKYLIAGVVTFVGGLICYKVGQKDKVEQHIEIYKNDYLMNQQIEL